MSKPVSRWWSRALVLMVALCCLWTATPGRADEAKFFNIRKLPLRDFDVSPEIRNLPRPEDARTLRPRLTLGYEQLRDAVWSSSAATLAGWLSVGADPNAISPDGEPLLHYAVRHGNREKVELLLKAGADPNGPGQNDSPPLDRAVWSGNKEIVSLLLAYGADPDRKSRDGRTPRENAKWHGRREIAALFDAKPARLLAPRPIRPPQVLRRPDAQFGSPLFNVPAGGQALAYTPDSRRLIAGDEDGALRFFDAQTGEVQDVLAAHEGAVLALAFIPQSRILISTGDDRTIRFWDIDTLQELKRLQDSTGYGKTLAVSPDGRFFNTGSRLWEIESVQPFRLAAHVREVHDPHHGFGGLWSFFTPDSRGLVISRDGKGIWVWDVAKNTLRRAKGLDQKSLQTIRGKDLADVLPPGAARPDDLLALVADQYTILTGPPAKLQEFEHLARSFSESPRALACSPNGQFLAALGYSCRIDVYDVETGAKFPHAGHTAAVLAVAVSPDGNWIASGGNDKIVRIWNRKSGEAVEAIPAQSFVYSVCFSPDGKLLAFGDNDGAFCLWDVEKKSLERHHTSGRVTDLAFDRQGAFLASLGFEVHLLDLSTRSTKARISAQSAQQWTFALSPDSRLIVGSAQSMAASETFKVPEAWALDGDQLFPAKDLFSEAMGHRTCIASVAFSPDGALLAASSEGAIRLWDMKQRKAVGETLYGHTYIIFDLKFAPDGKWLASASWDGTARLWQIPSGRQVVLLDPDVGRISCVDFTPQGELVTANWDGTVHLWDLSKFMREDRPAATRFRRIQNGVRSSETSAAPARSQR